MQPAMDDVVFASIDHAPLKPDTDERVLLSLRDLPDGRRAFLVYSSLDTLCACCGEDTPWMALTADGVLDIVDRAGCDVVLLDAPVPDTGADDVPTDHDEPDDGWDRELPRDLFSL